MYVIESNGDNHQAWLASSPQLLSALGAGRAQFRFGVSAVNENFISLVARSGNIVLPETMLTLHQSYFEVSNSRTVTLQLRASSTAFGEGNIQSVSGGGLAIAELGSAVILDLYAQQSIGSLVPLLIDSDNNNQIVFTYNNTLSIAHPRFVLSLIAISDNGSISNVRFIADGSHTLRLTQNEKRYCLKPFVRLKYLLWGN